MLECKSYLVSMIMVFKGSMNWFFEEVISGASH